MENIKLVQRRLWSNGHHTKMVPSKQGSFLVVDGVWSLRVVEGEMKNGVPVVPHLEGCDRVALLIKMPDGSFSISYSAVRNPKVFLKKF